MPEQLPGVETQNAREHKEPRKVYLQENSYACVCNPVPEDREEEKD